MKVYTIAKITNEVYGHGDAGKETRIVRMGPYGSGKFPPTFASETAAEDYRDELKVPFETVVVELELISE